MMIFRVVLIILSLDQLTKFFVTQKVLPDQPIPVIKGFFYLTLVHNRGAAFGIFKNHTYLFIITSIFAIALIYSCIKQYRQKEFSLYILALGLILAGALGNLIDRLFLGYVIDFLDFRVWPVVFNIADSSITIGAVLLGWGIIRMEDRREKMEERR